MMRSDMPKQIMAYRNGGGIPSLATSPRNYSNGGGISSFLSNAYNSAVGAVTNALGMNDDKSYAPELTTQPGPESNQMSAKEKFDSNRARQASVRAKERRKKRRARQAAAAANTSAANTNAANLAAANTNAANLAAATTAASESSAALEAAKADLAAFQGSDLAKDASIVKMLNNRDDLSILEKIEFAEQLAGDFGLTDSQGVAAAKALASNAALDIGSNLSAAERLELLQAAGVNEPGLIASFETAAAAETGAATPGPELALQPLTPAPGAATPGPAPAADNSAATIAGLEASLAQTNQQAASQIANLQAQIDALTAAQNTATPTSYGSFPGVSSGLPGTTNIDYGLSIIPNPGVTSAGIAGLPSTGTTPTSSFTAYLPPIQPVSISPLTLPSLI